MFIFSLLLLVVLLFFFWRPIWGLYFLAGTVFFSSGLVVYFSKYEWARNSAWLANLNAPIVDFVALFLILIVLVLLIFSKNIHWSAIKKVLTKPMVFYFSFLIVAGLSALLAYENNIGESVKYFLRFYVFVMVGFVLVPIIIVKDKKVLLNILKIWFWIGIMIALYGLSSLLVVSQASWLRVVPYSLFGFAPLGYNHNQIAEVLVAIIPIGLFLSFYNNLWRRFYLWGMGLMVLAVLLTFSRAGWLVLLFQFVCLLYFYGDKVKVWLKKQRWLLPAGIILSLSAIILMGIFLYSPIVKSSNSARIETSQAVWYYFKQAPLIGYGPGMYIRLIGNTWFLTNEFGDPLEAHGMIQKILAETGILGLILLGGFFFVILKTLWHKEKEMTSLSDKYLFVGLFLAVAGEIVFQLFNTSYFSGVMWMPIGIALASLIISEKEKI